MNDTFRVNSGFGDPVKDVNLATTDNVFYGYYGYGREKGERKHRGFDYAAKIGTDVFAIGAGSIVQVRIGTNISECYTFVNDKKTYIKDKETFKCPLLKSINCDKGSDKDHGKDSSERNNFSKDVCEECQKYYMKKDKKGTPTYNTIRSMCYGVQVWLKLDVDSRLYAFYAHLSKLDEEKLFPKVQEAFVGSNTIKIDVRVNKGDSIGSSGRTGIACDEQWPPHLHFECRKGNLETDHQISPNNIVKTQFVIMKGQKPVFNDTYDTTVWKKSNDGFFQKEWKSLFSNIGRIEKYNYSEKAIYYSSRKSVPYDVHPCYEINVNKIEVVSNKGKQSIEPYQIIKKSKDSYLIGRGMTCVYASEENGIEKGDHKSSINQSEQMPWGNKQ